MSVDARLFETTADAIYGWQDGDEANEQQTRAAFDALADGGYHVVQEGQAVVDGKVWRLDALHGWAHQVGDYRLAPID